MALSLFIVRVPEAEPFVEHLRERFDPSARRGMPAHITLLYPFMPPERITGDVIEQVHAVAMAASSFTFRLTRIEHFPKVLYLAPEPAAPFVELTMRLAQRFPEFPPYSKQNKAIVPHLSVVRGGESGQREAETELLTTLPPDGIACCCKEIMLFENASGRWQPMHSFSLSPQAA